MNDNDQTGPTRRHPIWQSWTDCALTLLAVYVIHYLFVSCFILGKVGDIIRPFKSIPLYVYNGWDAVLYRGLYYNYDRFNWPPLYPFALRLVAFLGGFHGTLAFEQSAAIL